MAEATATLERVDRAELVAVLDRLVEATGQLAETLRGDAEKDGGPTAPWCPPCWFRHLGRRV
jgi:hypothetical protein